MSDFDAWPEAVAFLEEKTLQDTVAILQPPPNLSVPDWADEYRRLSAAVGAVGGRWQTRRMEIARGPMMAVTEPGVKTISVMSCTQTMKTELMMNTLGYFTHLDPCPILILQPKDDMASAFSKERVSPMIESTPVLAKVMEDAKQGEDTVGYKRFPGGFLAISSAGSPSNLAMRAIRIVLLDEVDKYETTKEGDPIVLAEERMSTFAASSLSIRACSPTWEETSRIYRSFLAGDQRRAFIACPHCGYEQDLDFFRHVEWDKDPDGEHHPETAAIYCEGCGTAWPEADRSRLVTTKHGIRWYQTKPFLCCGQAQDPRVERLWDWDDEHQVGYARCKVCGGHPVPNIHASFTASKLYNPNLTVVGLVMKWLEAKDDPETKQTFYNTQLGIPFKAEVTREVSGHWLAKRREKYAAEVPAGVVVLTAGLDVQGGGAQSLGRIECEVVGWGPGEESWSIESRVFNGNPALPEVWAEVDEYLKRPFESELGVKLYIAAACIDSGGHNTQEVYTFCRNRTGRNIWATKGASDRGVNWSPIWPPLSSEQKHQKFRVGFKPIMLGVNSAKENIRQRLLIEEPGPGYCHFHEAIPDSWFMQLTSENLRVERKSGAMLRRWVLKKGLANEALDCRVYAYAALHGLYHTRRLDLNKRRQTLDAYVHQQKHAETTSTPSNAEPAPARNNERRIRPSPFLDG